MNTFVILLCYPNATHILPTFKNNMGNALITCADKILLCKRKMIESAHNEIKHIATIQYSRHRSVTNFLTDTLAAVAAYQYFPKKHHLTSCRNTLYRNTLNPFLLF